LGGTYFLPGDSYFFGEILTFLKKIITFSGR
jgi:hypothetical protein